VNGVLRTQSGYTFYHPVLELPDYEPPKDDTPAKAARAEGQAAVTPVRAAVPPLPAAVNPDDGADAVLVVEDDDDEFKIPAAIEYVFGVMLAFSTRCEKATSRRGGRGSPSRAAKCPWSGISTGQAQTANRKSRVRQPAAFPHLWSLRLSLDSGPFGPQRLTGTLVVL
jgi:hypothetical protein